LDSFGPSFKNGTKFSHLKLHGLQIFFFIYIDTTQPKPPPPTTTAEHITLLATPIPPRCHPHKKQSSGVKPKKSSQTSSREVTAISPTLPAKISRQSERSIFLIVQAKSFVAIFAILKPL
jgi:hypothetical protein